MRKLRYIFETIKNKYGKHIYVVFLLNTYKAIIYTLFRFDNLDV